MNEKNSFQYFTRIIKFCLQFYGIVPLNGPPTDGKRRFSKLLQIVTLTCITSFNLPVFHYILSTNLNLEERLDVLNVVAGVFGGECRMIFVFLYREKIHRLMVMCETLWPDGNSTGLKIVTVWAYRAKLLSFTLFSVTVFAVSFYLFTPIIKQMSPGAENITRTWPYPINMDSSQSPRYEICYTIQFFAASIDILSIIGCDLIGTVFALHACGQLRLIGSWLTNIQPGKMTSDRKHVNKKAEKTLRKCINRHQIVMDFCAEIEEVVCFINLAQALGGMYMLAISAARLSRLRARGGSYKPIGPLILAIGQLFLSCWPADNLFVESTTLAKAIYAVPWYDYSPRIKKAIIIMMARSQRPARLTAGKFVTFSLETFFSIVSTAMSIFMLLRSFDPPTSA